jgi:hypothetical protein
VELIGFAPGVEAEPSKTADKLCGDMEPLDDKRVAADLIVFKQKTNLAGRFAHYRNVAEDPDEHPADTVFWVPKEARRLPCSTS